MAFNKVQRRREQSIIRKWFTSLYCCGTPQVLQLLQSCVGPQHGHPPCIRRDRSSAPSRLRHLSSTISFNQPRVWFSQARFEFEGWYLNTSKRVSPKVLRMAHSTVLSTSRTQLNPRNLSPSINIMKIFRSIGVVIATIQIGAYAACICCMYQLGPQCHTYILINYCPYFQHSERPHVSNTVKLRGKSTELTNTVLILRRKFC